MATTTYASGTVIASSWLNDVDDATYKAAKNLTGASARSALARNAEWVSVKDFGAVGDGATDDTAAIQAAITFVSSLYPDSTWFSNTSYSRPRILWFPSSIYKVNSKLLLPSGVIIRGNNSTLVGTGNTASDNICFESAYINGGVVTSNIGQSAETQRVQFTEVDGLKLINFKQGFNLYNCNEGCRFTNITYFNCYQPLFADRCFYARFQNHFSKEATALAVATVAAFDFRDFVNVQSLDSIFITNRILGMSFSGGVNGQSLRNCSVESGTNGIVFTGNVNPMNIDSCYFENLTGTALDFTAGGGTNAITIDNNWFFTCGTAIAGNNMLGGVIGRGNYFSGTTPVKVSITDVVSTIKVELPFVRVADNSGTLRPAIASGYTLGAGCIVEQPSEIYFSANGVTVNQQMYGAALRPDLPFSGQQGVTPAKVAFCDNSLSGTGASVSLFIDTKIVYDAYCSGFYSLILTDSTSAYAINGRFYCNGNVCVSDTAGKPIAVSNNGGFVRLTITTVNNPAGAASCEGIVRMY